MRDTFMKVGQSLMVKKQLVTEKGLKEKMIHSVMPPKVADWLMTEGHADDMDEGTSGFPMSSVSAVNSSGDDKKGKNALTKEDSDSECEDSDSEDVAVGPSPRKISSPRQGIYFLYFPGFFCAKKIDRQLIFFTDFNGFLTNFQIIKPG